MMHMNRWRTLTAGLGAVLASCVLAGSLVAGAGPREAICVAPFSNNTGDASYEALAEAVADMLAVALAEQKNVTVVERQQLCKVLDEQKLSLAGLADPATAVKVGKLLKADRILVGGMIKHGGKLVVSAQVYEIASARLAGSAQVQGKSGQVPKLIQGLTTKLGKALGVALGPVDPKDVDKNPRASACFMRGLGFHFAGNYDRAVMEFMKAQDLDPKLDKAGYWMALSFMKNKELKHARIELEELLRKHPKSALRDEARKLIEKCSKSLSTRPASRPAESGGKKKGGA